MIAIGQPDDAARVLAFVSDSGVQRWVLPEILRIRAAIERLSGRPHDAVKTLRKSLQVADEIGGLSWKLRAAVDLARLLQIQGSTNEAREILTPVFGEFTDGFSSGDLTAARTLVEQLSDTGDSSGSR
jgi:predicted ATPase